MTQEEIEKMFLTWWQSESPKDIAYASTQNIAAVGFSAGVKAAQQGVQRIGLRCGHEYMQLIEGSWYCGVCGQPANR